ncbi:MAG: fatty acid desaturase [Candidatus Poriferisodalaceae bacterium]
MTALHPPIEARERVRQVVAERGLAEQSPARSFAWLVGAPAGWFGAYFAANAIGHWATWVAAWTFQGLLTLSAVAGQHEAIHRNLFRSRWANHVAGQIWGTFVLFPYGLYRTGHLQHHVATHREGDTEPLELYTGLRQYLLLTPLSGPMFLVMNFWAALKTMVGRPPTHIRTPQQRRIANMSTALLLGTLTSVALLLRHDPGILVRAWLAPFVIGSLIVATVTLPEHYLCRLGDGTAFETTRTIVSNPVIRFFFWGTNFHTAHHLVAGVPAHKLRVLHNDLAGTYDHVESGYIKWHLRLACQLATDPAGQLTSSNHGG